MRMTKMNFLAVATAVSVLSLAGSASADTLWNTTKGDWSKAKNWEPNTKPSAEDNVKIQNGGTAEITRSGSTCKYLYVGSTDGDGNLEMPGGSISIAGSTYVGQDGGVGTFEMSGGTFYSGVYFSAGYSGAGTVTQTGGKLKCYSHGAAVSRYAGSDGSVFAISGGLFVTPSLSIGEGAPGTFKVVGGDSVITINYNGGLYVQYAQGTLAVEINKTGIRTIKVADDATLAGTFTVVDDGADDGTYIILTTGDGIDGTFETVNLPEDGDWSWGVDEIEGDETLWVKKGK